MELGFELTTPDIDIDSFRKILCIFGPVTRNLNLKPEVMTACWFEGCAPAARRAHPESPRNVEATSWSKEDY